MNGKKCRVGGGGGCCICYIILGGWSPEMLYSVYIGWGGGQKFPIFALYNMCTTPMHLETNYMNMQNKTDFRHTRSKAVITSTILWV